MRIWSYWEKVSALKMESGKESTRMYEKGTSVDPLPVKKGVKGTRGAWKGTREKTSTGVTFPLDVET